MFISLDIGGTNTRVALSNNCRDVDYIETFKTHSDPAKEILFIKEYIVKHTKIDEINGMCLGIAGVLDNEKKKLVQGHNLKNYEGLDLSKLFSALTSTKVFYIYNDADLAGYGEAILGAGKNYKVVGYLTLGTGVGGVKIENKKMSTQQISEPGQMIVNFGAPDGSVTVESYLSGDSELIKNQNWEEYGKILGITIINIAFMWNPEIVVIGGGISGSYDKFINSTNNVLSEFEFPFLPKVVKSSFGQGSGIVGGFALLSDKLNI